jgi:hypothetical protein
MPAPLVRVALVAALSAGRLSRLILRRAGLLSLLTALLRQALGLEFLSALFHLSAKRLHLFV